jgi:hypothetical protein
MCYSPSTIIFARFAIWATLRDPLLDFIEAPAH